MNKPIFILILILVVIPFRNNAQRKFDKIDFTAVDKFARSVKPTDDVEKLAKELTTPYTEDVYKLRSIFIWVAEYIKYDVESFNSEKYKQVNFKYKTQAELALKYKEWEDGRILTVLKSQKAVCSGYSALMKRMCDIANIKCEEVSGYSKTKPYEVGIPLSANHAWNAVMLDSSYYFLDATWAAGGCFENEETDKLTKFKKGYDDYYWLTPTDNFLRNHYPSNNKWLFKEGYTRDMFFNAPFYSPQIIGNINLLSPSSGVLQVKAGDTIHFKFTDEDNFNYIQMNYTSYVSPTLPYKRLENGEVEVYTKDSATLKGARFLPFIHKGNNYEFDFIVPDQTIYFVEVLFNFRTALKFRVNYD